MTTAPNWSAVDDDTADLLALVADVDHPSVDHEWQFYAEALAVAADELGVISPNHLRELVRGNVAPRRIGAFARRAVSLGLVEYTGRWVVSDDTEGRNSGKPVREMRWLSQT